VLTVEGLRAEAAQLRLDADALDVVADYLETPLEELKQHLADKNLSEDNR
jgi:hypothetical protein